MRGALLVATLLSIGATPHAVAAGDPVKGEQLHRACLGCHATELYIAPRAKVKTHVALTKEILKWNDRMNPKFTKKELDDIAAYLDRDFYRLTR